METAGAIIEWYVIDGEIYKVIKKCQGLTEEYKVRNFEGPIQISNIEKFLGDAEKINNIRRAQRFINQELESGGVPFYSLDAGLN